MTDRFGMGLVVLVGTGVLTATAFAILAPLVRSCSGLEALKTFHPLNASFRPISESVWADELQGRRA